MVAKAAGGSSCWTSGVPVVILVVCFMVTAVVGDCFYDGQHFANHSIWQSSPCKLCTCNDPVPVCENIQCHDPHCDYARGQQLQKEEGACCPGCVDMGRPCQFQGQPVPDKTSWTPSQCVKCTCDNGEVRCSRMTCSPVTCKPGQVSQSLPGQCCPKCLPTGRPCTDEEGSRREDGAEWSPLPCVLCVCRDGQSKCLPRQCPRPACPQEDLVAPGPGQCCPRCRSEQCQHMGYFYQDGQVWKRDTCTTCLCHLGTVHCRTQHCDATPNCQKGEIAATRPGQCCPQCVLQTGACDVESTRRYHGDLWNISDCEFCMCRRGKVQCRTLVCPSVKCTQGQVLFHPIGKCCAECVTPPVCHHEGQTFQDGATWDSDPCTVCTCKEGEVRCYRKTCPLCPDGQSHVKRPGQCCGHCETVQCSAACLSCLPHSPSYCTQCREPGRLLQTGQCTDRCQQGYYPVANNTCLACDGSCQTCIDGTRYHCTSCPPSSLLKDGQCVSRCGPGYFLRNGECLACDASCSSCSGPSPSQCVSCARGGQLLQQGACVDSCPPRQYLLGRNCMVCPPTCRTCVSDSPQCSSCHSHHFLHKGECLPDCPRGYYGNKDFRCQACHPTCETCDGGFGSSCTTCPEGDTLYNGRCQPACPGGQYLTHDSLCSACDPGCRDCVAARGGLMSACTRCEDPSQVAVGSSCTDKCSPGTYLRDGICYGCEDKCEECDGPGLCTRCFPPFLQSAGHCVQSCPERSFTDNENNCRPCPDHCLTCLNGQVCVSCDSITYMWKGTCTQACEQGLVADLQDRVCYENVYPPEVKITGPLLVPDRDMALLSPAVVQVTDHDTPGRRLSLHLVTLPANGQLLLTSSGREVVLGHGDSFSAQDMAEGRLRFVHTDDTIRKGELEFRVSDGQLTTDTVSLPVRILPAQPLSVRVNQPLIAVKGSDTPLTLDTLDLRSMAQEDDVTLHVVDGPKHGDFLNIVSGKVIQSFTLSDLHLEDVVYRHHGNSSSFSDMAMLLASDAFEQLSIILSITLRLKNSMTPVVVANNGGQVMPGHKLQISNDLLQVKAMGQSSSDVIYTLVPTINNPRKGEVMMIVPTPEGGPGRGWEDMGDGTMGAKMFRFLQRDIDEGRIYYKHQGSPIATTDIFTFEVADMSEPPNVLQNQSFHIRVLPEVQKDSSQFALPTLAPGVRLGMTVLENQVVPITSSHLAYRDLDTRDRDLVYRLTSLLGEDEGTIEHIDFPFKPVLQFTQQDINNNRILYRPPDHEIGLAEKEVSFNFVLTDDADDQQLPEQKFTIRIVPVNNMPPRFLTPNARLTVAEGTTVPIPAHMLEVLDPDTVPEDLTFTVIEEPEVGYLERVDREFVVVLRAGDSFPYTEVQSNTFQYTHSGAEGESTDFIFLSVSDGAFHVGSTITVNILKVDKSAPVLLPTSSCQINVTEGSTVWIEREHLAFSDSDDGDEDVMIIMSSATAHGQLLVGEPARIVSPGDIFTQADINSGFLRFVADGEIGSKAVTELLYFNVSDASRNLLPSQVMSVLILPVNNQPPVVTVAHDLEVEEGGEAQIISPMISIMDVDTPIADLKMKVTASPSFGLLVIRNPVVGSERAGRQDVTELAVKDLIQGHLTYVQSDHLKKEPAWDAFLFIVTDGVNTSLVHRFNFTIIPVNDEPPYIVTEQLFVKEGQSVTLTNASMYVVDLDTVPVDLMLTLRLPPVSGTLKRKEFFMDPLSMARPLTQNSSFTYEDVLQELIVYEHNDDEITTDMLVLHVTDGDFDDTKQLNIIIGLINDETPRVTINRGLRIKAGSTTTIKPSDLRATDVDSDDSDIIYTMKKNPTAGRLQYRAPDGTTSVLTVEGPRSVFTQDDIDHGRIDYIHETGELTGTLLFKFMLSDTEGNDLIDQDFFITVMEDRFPPSEVANKEMVVKEGERQKVTTDFLSFTDVDSEPGSLLYQVFEGPDLGHLELTKDPGVPVVEFTQSDLAAGSVYYVHTSTSELYMDRFIFAVTDGTNEVVQTFYISLTPVDDAIPMVINNGLRAQEGVRKLITEFDLKAVDPDTKEEDVVFTVIEPPVHGTLDLEVGKGHVQASRFSMSDIYENRVSYHHSGTEHFADTFTFTVSDGTNYMFTMQSDQPSGPPHLPLTSPQKFHIDILPMDDGTPVLQANLGLNFLEKSESLAGNYITERELKSTDEDSPARDIVYAITKPPVRGVVERSDQPGQQLATFTQEDINDGLIRYMLHDDVSEDLQDMFEFDVMDAKPNVVKGNTFHIRWSKVYLGSPVFNVSETAGILQVPVMRNGNLKQYAVVQCQTKAGKAVSEEGAAQPGLFDFVHYSGQVQFDEWQDVKMCSILINDDSTYEGPEQFYVELFSPTYALLGDVTAASVTIMDEEDVPTIQFEQEVIHVNETDVYVMATLRRTGDLSDTISVVCSTTSMTATGSSLTGLESGSDFISRGNTNSFRVIFPAGISTATCDVKVIDDSDYESAEQFELHLSEPSLPAVLGPLATAIVIIEGPNDESHVLLSAPDYQFPEDAGVVEVEVLREGSDLSHTTTVWCATRLSHPPSATPGIDYAPSSSQITFTPGQISQKCQLTVLDDDYDPRVEGSETFEVFLSSAMGSTLARPHHSTVVIYDEILDVPTFTFMQDSYSVDEKNKSVNATILRLGDLTLSASVICYTRQLTASVMADYAERVHTNQSRVYFEPGDRQKNCTVAIVDDLDFERDEEFHLRLADPVTEDGLTAQLGDIEAVTVTITNHDDVPKVQLEKSAYSVHEPSVKEQITTVVVRVLRTGADNQTSSIRCSTRDGSARSGFDYNARSLRVTFPPGVREVEFPVDILYNSDVEWHEAFTVLLGPEDPEGAMFGPITMATITILDNEVSGSLVLPAPPVVVSLLHYDDAEQGTKVDPSPGYPLVCINPCDVHYPTYTVTHTLCKDTGINSSAILYQWEVAMPPDASGSRSPFILVSDNTLFTSTTERVLDSVYFRSYFRVRCVAQPLHANGNPGVPLRSSPVTIGRNNGICNPPAFGGNLHGYHAQSFLATLNYVTPDGERHPNTIHIRVEIPHQDGMLPLVSTFPLHNIRFLLSEPVYRQQHVCSNIITASERAPLLDEGFLDALVDDHQLPFGPGYDFAYQFDRELREEKTLTLYRHLDLKRCIWTFDAYYHMSELVDICGGRVVSDFTVKDRTHTHLTVRVPLHVSYLFAAAPVGWTSLEHRTEMELAFYYNTVLWRAGLETEGRLGGKLQIKRILIGQDGKLVIEFRTQAKFRGLYVLSHHTAPGVESRVLAPKSLAISFDLELTWSQDTFDSPHQMWQATSRYNLKDYTGMYAIELIPCAVTPTQAYVNADPLPCTAGQPQRFEVPLSFQQTNRPVPVVYSLDTQLQLTNNLKLFLLDPSTASMTPDDWDFNGAFSRGQNLYGRVLWSPSQDLKAAYKLTIEKVYLCTGSDGYIPTYDPTGDIYNEGPQYGCIQPSSALLFRFLILDRENPDVVQSNFRDIPFQASFASGRQELSPVLDMPGVDGFVFNVDPLYKVDSGHQWYLQVVYLIGPADTPFYRHRREASAPTPYPVSAKASSRYRDLYSRLNVDTPRNGTNMQRILMDHPSLGTATTTSAFYPFYAILPVIILIIASAAVTIVIVCVRKRRRKRKNCDSVTMKRNNLAQSRPNLRVSVTSINSPSFSVSNPNLNRVSSKGELKNIAAAAKCNIIKAKDVNLLARQNVNVDDGTEV